MLHSDYYDYITNLRSYAYNLQRKIGILGHTSSLIYQLGPYIHAELSKVKFNIHSALVYCWTLENISAENKLLLKCEMLILEHILNGILFHLF